MSPRQPQRRQRERHAGIDPVATTMHARPTANVHADSLADQRASKISPKSPIADEVPKWWTKIK